MPAIPDKYLDLVQQKKVFAQGQISVSPAGRDAVDLRDRADRDAGDGLSLC